MSWIYIKPLPPPPHNCPTPGWKELMDAKADVGSIWRCDTCHKEYEFRGSDMGVLFWKPTL